MSSSEIYPQLRTVELRNAGGALRLVDPLDGRTIVLPPHEVLAASLLDGKSTAKSILLRVSEQTGPEFGVRDLQRLVGRLSNAYFLQDAPGREHERRCRRALMDAPLRLAAHSGSAYPSDRSACAQFVDQLLDTASCGAAGEGGREPRCSARGTSALLSPHIDYTRGAAVYSSLWAPLRGHLESIDRVIILGTSHGGGKQPFLVTRKAFETPLGVMPVATEVVDALIKGGAHATWDTELLHRREHSIELQLPLLQRCLPSAEVPIVPLLCGSIHQAIHTLSRPEEIQEVRTAIETLRDAVATMSGRTLWIAAGDLAHIGMHFGDAPEPLSDAQLHEVRSRDLELLTALARGDGQALTDHLLTDGDARRICGYGPMWALLAAAQPENGQLIAYGQAVDSRRSLAVSFAGVRFGC
jgi:AmmeMemoRadiSam system protein B